MKIRTDISPDPLPATFEGLCTLHQLRPIRDEIDYDNAVSLVDRLAVLDTRTRDQDDYLGTLTELIGKYDDEHYSSDLAGIKSIDSLKFLMEQNGMNPSDLADLLGEGASLAEKLLNGKQELNTMQIRVLAERFKVNPGLFF